VGGDFLPVYFRGLEFPPGRDPLCVYATALSLKLLPVSEAAVRLPTALVGLANIALAYALGSRLQGRQFGLLAALLLALTPAHFIHSRIGIPTLWSTPFLLGWLVGLARYERTRDVRTLSLAMVCLGLAVFGYLGTALLVPLYLAGSLGYVYYGVRERRWQAYAAICIAFAAPLLLLAYWHMLHPERWSELAAFYASNPAVIRSAGTPALLGPEGLPNLAAVQHRLSVYWDYFDPSFLFLRGDASPRYSTGRSGIFVLASIILLPVGAVRAWRTHLGRLILFCFLCSPVIAALQGELQIQRALPMVVCGALLSAFGAGGLLEHPAPRQRRIGVALLIASVAQFGLFAADYFTHYRLRSGFSRGGNLREALAEAIEAGKDRGARAIYLDERIVNISLYWDFYSAVMHADALRNRVVVLDPARSTEASPPPGALLVTHTAGSDVIGTAGGTWQLRRRVYELDGPTYYSVYEVRP
jgi:4-amino-4-deoxy-L-arabinose transferase-like glycosyltransferase